MDVVRGALAGLGGGLVAGYAASWLLLQAKRWRNGRLLARGGIGYKDCALTPLWIFGAVVGGIGGGVAGTWPAGLIAGAAFPALMLVLGSARAVRQSREPIV